MRGSAAVAILRDDRAGPARPRPPHAPAARSSATATGSLLFASTREALDTWPAAPACGSRSSRIDDGTLLEVEDGREVARRRFDVDYRFPGRKIVEYPALPGKERLLVRLASLLAA